MTILERKLKFTTSRLVDRIEKASIESPCYQMNQQPRRIPGSLSGLKQMSDLCLKAAELKHEMTA